MLWGRCSHPAYKQARSRICQLFTTKNCTKMVDGQDVGNLEAQWCKNGSRARVHMNTYIDTLAEVTVEGKVEEKLSKELIAMARRLLVQLRWPISHVISELAYDISRMAHKNYDEWTIGDRRELSGMVGRANTAKTENRACFEVKKQDCELMTVVTPVDADLARQIGMRSKLWVHEFHHEPRHRDQRSRLLTGGIRELGDPS